MSILMLLAAVTVPTMPDVPTPSARDLNPIAIIKSSNRRGSGFLIGPCTAMTVRHVLAKQVKGERVKLSLPLLGTSTKATVIDTGSGFRGVPKGYERGDWAILRLDKCLGADAGYFPLASRIVHADQWIGEWGTALLAGYPARHNWRSGPYVGPPCTVMSDTIERIDSNCYSYPGHSGSPLLQWQKVDRGWKLFVIGIVATGGWGPKSPSQQYRLSEAVPISRAAQTLAQNGPGQSFDER